MTFRMMQISPTARMGRQTRKIMEIPESIRKAAVMEKISMRGERITIRVIIW